MDEQAGFDEDDSVIEIELRPAAEVAARMVILAAVIRRSALELPLDDEDEEEDDEPDSPEGEQFDILTALTTGPLAQHVTQAELALVRSPIGSQDEATALEAFWQIEALAALAAVVSPGSELPGPWEQTQTGPLLAAVPEPWDDFAPFSGSIELLDEERIALQRERAELWLWRSSIDEELRQAGGRELSELRDIMRETVAEANDAGILSGGKSDFQVRGRDFAKADVESKALIAEIATQRLHAFNWLCGFGESWDAVPLDI